MRSTAVSADLAHVDPSTAVETGSASILVEADGADWQSRVKDLLVRANTEAGGMIAVPIVLLATILANLIGWYPMIAPVRLLNRIAATLLPGSVPGVPGSFLHNILGASVGILTVFGSAVVLVLIFVFRDTLRGLLKGVSDRIPDEARFLITPVITTLVFTAAWGGNAFHFFGRPGLVRDGLFPALVGLFSFLLSRHGPALKEKLTFVTTVHARVPTRLRPVAALGVVWILSVLLTPLFRAPVRDQLVAILGMIVAYLFMVPDQVRAAAGVPSDDGRMEGMIR